MTRIKKWFKFVDGSIAYLPDDNFWTYKPVEVYTSSELGFGEWIKY